VFGELARFVAEAVRIIGGEPRIADLAGLVDRRPAVSGIGIVDAAAPLRHHEAIVLEDAEGLPCREVIGLVAGRSVAGLRADAVRETFDRLHAGGLIAERDLRRFFHVLAAMPGREQKRNIFRRLPQRLDLTDRRFAAPGMAEHAALSRRIRFEIGNGAGELWGTELVHHTGKVEAISEAPLPLEMAEGADRERRRDADVNGARRLHMVAAAVAERDVAGAVALRILGEELDRAGDRRVT
jgi:hypothetical protein